METEKTMPTFRYGERGDCALIFRFIRELARIALKRGYGRFEWSCLDWNRPSIEFYLSLGAEPMREWTVYRLSGDSLTELAKGS